MKDRELIRQALYDIEQHAQLIVDEAYSAKFRQNLVILILKSVAQIKEVTA